MGCGNGMQSLGGGARSLPGGVRWFDLLAGETVIATTVSNSTFDEKVLECPELEEMGPALQDLTVHLEMRGRTGNFECQVAIQYKYEDFEWSQVQGAGDVLLSLVSADGYPAPTVFSDRSRLGRRRIRLVLQYRTATGGAVGDRALLRIGVACRPFCC